MIGHSKIDGFAESFTESLFFSGLAHIFHKKEVSKLKNDPFNTAVPLTRLRLADFSQFGTPH
jgi:hypothetical protein